METFVAQVDWGTALDGVAVVCSLVVILFLLHNRRKYGRILLNARNDKGQVGFADQVSLHMMAQQSQRVYDNLQQSLAREFASLRTMGVDRVVQRPEGIRGPLPKTAVMGDPDRCQRYRLAEEMIRQGDTVDRISQQCGLMEGELELLRGLQQLAEERIPGPSTKKEMPADMSFNSP